MEWHVGLELTRDNGHFKISASDIASSSECGRHHALKARPSVKSREWKQSYSSAPFLLGRVVDLIEAAHRAADSSELLELHRWLPEEIRRLNLPRLTRHYAESAVENYLDAHEAIESLIGAQLHLINTKPEVTWPESKMTLSAWGPLYTTDDGVREIRRLRIGAAHPHLTDEDKLWGIAAARVAVDARGPVPASRIRAVEIGLLDGTFSVLFDDPPDVAEAQFARQGVPRGRALTNGTSVAPGQSCEGCKIGGVCDALPDLSGTLSQTQAGNGFRSISPSQLDQYRRCPGQWFLDSELHLPKEDGDWDEPRLRGIAVHRWLEAAHKRDLPCRADDLPTPGESVGMAIGVLSPEDYALAYPYLRAHLGQCPLANPEVRIEQIEKTIHGLDRAAQVIVATKPDIVLRQGDRTIIREVKTAAVSPVNGRAEVYSQTLQIPFLISMLASGLSTHFRTPKWTVELEHLTPEGGKLWVWDSEDERTIRVALGDVRDVVEAWHTDRDWETIPGPQCAWCPVRRWCPDRDAFAIRQASPVRSQSPQEYTGSSLADMPPF